MGYEHLSITPETEYDKVTESNVENLLPIPSKCEVTLEDEIEFWNGDAQQEEIAIVTRSDDVFPSSVENDDDLSNDLLLGEADLFLSDNSIPPDTSQISSIHTIAPIQSTKELEHLLSMGYEHLSITPETESDEVTESNAENLLPIPSKCEVTLEDEIESAEYDFVESLLNRDTFIDFSSTFDFSGELAHIKPEIPKSDFDFEEEIRLIENLLYDNSFPRPPEELNAKIADTIIESIPLLPIPVQDGNSQQEEIDIVTKTDDVLPPSDDNDDDLLNDPLLEEADLFLVSDNLIPPGIENVADDPERDIHFLEELLIDDFILSHESYDSNFEDNPLISRPPPEPPDDNFNLEPDVISAVMKDIDEPNEHFNPGGEIFVSTNNEDVDYFPFMFVIRIFLPYPILSEISPLLLSAESEDTIFDPGISE
nr:hypothetical protein [Tanacetum cinerariifolium]